MATGGGGAAALGHAAAAELKALEEKKRAAIVARRRKRDGGAAAGPTDADPPPPPPPAASVEASPLARLRVVPFDAGKLSRLRPDLHALDEVCRCCVVPSPCTDMHRRRDARGVERTTHLDPVKTPTDRSHALRRQPTVERREPLRRE